MEMREVNEATQSTAANVAMVLQLMQSQHGGMTERGSRELLKE